MPRKVTIQLMEQVDNGLLSWETIAKEALSYMSEDDVADMAHHGQLIYIEDEDNN